MTATYGDLNGQHIAVDTIGGHATISVHQRDGDSCLVMPGAPLDPVDVARLAGQLMRALLTRTPPRVAHVRVRRGAMTDWGNWHWTCPECELPLLRTYQDQPAALAGALSHIARVHSQDPVIRDRLRFWGRP